MSKIVIFVRVSTESQDLVQQKNVLIQEAVRLGYPIENHIIIEHKESAISLKEAERLGIEELKNNVNKDSSINCLICWELSRIGRRADVIISVRDFLLEHKIRWIVYTPYMELIDNEGKQNQMANLLLGVFTSFAESEMQIKKERAARGIAYKKSLGKHYGGKILTGYAVTKENNYIPDPYWSKYIRKLFTMYATGKYSLRALAKELKEQGFYPNATLHSVPHIISAQLKDPRYNGSIKGYPMIVPMTLWNRCQEVAKNHNFVQKTVNTHEMLCKGIIFSDVTGYALTPRPSKRQYLSHPDYGKCVGILSKYIDPIVMEFTEKMVKAHLMNPNQLKQDIQHSIQLLTRKIQTVKVEEFKTQEKIDRVEERYINGHISQDKADAMVAEFRKQLKLLKDKSLQLETEREEMGKKFTNVKPIDFNNLTFDEKRQWVLQVVKAVYVSKPKPLSRTNHIRIECKIDGNIYEYDISSHNRKNS